MFNPKDLGQFKNLEMYNTSFLTLHRFQLKGEKILPYDCLEYNAGWKFYFYPAGINMSLNH